VRLSGGADLWQQVENQCIVCAGNFDRFHGYGNCFGADLDVEQLQGIEINRVFPAAQGSQQGRQRGFLAVVARAGVGKSWSDEEFSLDGVETGVQITGHGQVHLTDSELDILTSDIGHHHQIPAGKDPVHGDDVVMDDQPVQGFEDNIALQLFVLRRDVQRQDFFE